MANNLLMRNLSPEVNEALELFKSQHLIKSNTTAAEQMLVGYHEQKETINQQRNEIQKLQSEMESLRTSLSNYLRAQEIMEESTDELIRFATDMD